MTAMSDGAMCALARDRGLVAVECDGIIRPATLIAWRPTRRNRRVNTARVRFQSGESATVPLERVGLLGQHHQGMAS